MRVMVLVKASPETEAGEMPTEENLAAMGEFNQQLVDAGVMIAGEGLHPTSRGVRVKFVDNDTTVIDGPFSETNELIAGFWIFEVDTVDEAVDWVRKAPMQDTELEIRPIFEAEDFGEEFTPELREQEEKMREQIESRI